MSRDKLKEVIGKAVNDYNITAASGKLSEFITDAILQAGFIHKPLPVKYDVIGLSKVINCAKTEWDVDNKFEESKEGESLESNNIDEHIAKAIVDAGYIHKSEAVEFVELDKKKCFE